MFLLIDNIPFCSYKTKNTNLVMNVVVFLCDKLDQLEGILKIVIKVRNLDIEMKIVQFTYAYNIQKQEGNKFG